MNLHKILFLVSTLSFSISVDCMEHKNQKQLLPISVIGNFLFLIEKERAKEKEKFCKGLFEIINNKISILNTFSKECYSIKIKNFPYNTQKKGYNFQKERSKDVPVIFTKLMLHTVTLLFKDQYIVDAFKSETLKEKDNYKKDILTFLLNNKDEISANIDKIDFFGRKNFKHLIIKEGAIESIRLTNITLFSTIIGFFKKNHTTTLIKLFPELFSNFEDFFNMPYYIYDEEESLLYNKNKVAPKPFNIEMGLFPCNIYYSAKSEEKYYNLLNLLLVQEDCNLLKNQLNTLLVHLSIIKETLVFDRCENFNMYRQYNI